MTPLLLASSACYLSGLHAHTGDLVEPRSAGVDIGGTLLTVSPAEGTFASGDALDASFGQRALPHPLVDFMYGAVLQGQLTTRWGAAQGLELDLVTGMQELGGTARIGLASGGRVSASLDLGGGWSPTFPLDLAGGPRTSLGVAVSHRGRGWSPLVDAQLSYGPEVYVAPLPGRLRRGCLSFSGPGCSEYGPPATFDVVRDELRLTAALGGSSARAGWLASGACADDDDCHEVVVAVEPYVVVLAGEPLVMRAFGGSSRTSGFQSHAGVSVQVEIHVGGAPPTRWEEQRFTDEQGVSYDCRRVSYVDDGPCRSTWADGSTREEGTYHRDRKVGRWVEGYPGGAVRSIVDYVRGRPWTTVAVLLPDGTPVDGVGVRGGSGVFVALDPDGDELERGALVRGRKEGSWMETLDGVSRGAYHRGRRVGPWRTEGADWTWEGAYRRGKRDGLATRYGPDGGVTRVQRCHRDRCEDVAP